MIGESKPKTRSQRRKEEGKLGRSMRFRDSNQDNGRQSKQVNQTIIDEIETAQKDERKGWTSIKDVESKLVELENEYKKAKDARTRTTIRKLIDVYEKQTKKINIETSKKHQENYVSKSRNRKQTHK